MIKENEEDLDVHVALTLLESWRRKDSTGHGRRKLQETERSEQNSSPLQQWEKKLRISKYVIIDDLLRRWKMISD